MCVHCYLIFIVPSLLETYVLQHEGGRAAYEDAQKQISEIQVKIETKASGVKDIQDRSGKLKQEASEARKMELVSSL